MDATPIRVLIADDQELIRRGMQLMLSFEPDFTVVGQAADGVEAVEMALRLVPDVVLMDLHMPRKGGVAATREIASVRPGVRVLVLTTLDAEDTVYEAIRAGAQAYLLKDASEQELLDTIRRVHRGESVLTPRIARKVMDQFRTLCAPAPAPPSGAGAAALTGKEQRILELIVEGRGNREIARTVFLAEGTVRNYVSRIMEKFHANSRTELAVISLRGRAASTDRDPRSR